MKQLLICTLVLFLLLPKVGILDFSILPLFFPILMKIRESFSCLRNVKVDLYIVLALLIMLFTLGILTFLYHGEVASQILFKPLRLIIVCILLYIIFNVYSLDRLDILRVIMLASAINAAVVLIQYASGLLIPGNPGDFLMNPGFDDSINAAWRKPGLFAGYPHSGIMSAFGLLSCCVLLLVDKISITYIVSFALCFTGLFLSSRTGLLFGMVGGIIFVPLLFSRSKKHFILFASFLLFFVSTFIYLVSSDILQPDTFLMMFEFFYNLESGNVQTESSDALIDSLYYPVENISTALIGNGFTTLADNKLNVDTGIQVLIFNGGLIATFLYYFLYFYFAWRAIAEGSRIKFSVYTIFVFLLFSFGLLSNLKVQFLFSRGPADVLLLLLFLSYAFNNNIKRKVEI